MNGRAEKLLLHFLHYPHPCGAYLAWRQAETAPALPALTTSLLVGCRCYQRGNLSMTYVVPNRLPRYARNDRMLVVKMMINF